MNYSITNIGKKKNYEFIHKMGMEACNIIFIDRGLTLKEYQEYIANMNESRIDNFFKNNFKILIEFSKIILTDMNFKKVIRNVDRLLNLYPNEELNLSDRNIIVINDIADKILLNRIINNEEYDYLSMKKLLIENNILSEQINNALLWICLRFSFFYQCYGLIEFEDILHK